jgi:hypothetical protein
MKKNNKNIYDQFLDYLKTKQVALYKKEKDLEKHHILPLHDGGAMVCINHS